MSKSCKKCSRILSVDEKAIYKRLINRGATEFLCADCLAEQLKCPRELIDQKIEHFKEIGCTLFSK